MLGESRGSLLSGHDLVLFDLDGVLYVSDRALPGAAEAVAGVRRAGGRVGYLTNNASRTAEAVAARLTGLGVPAEPDEVITSAQAAARLLAGELAPGSAVRVLGATGLSEAVAREGLLPVDGEHPAPVAVTTGYGPDVRWREVMEVAVLIRRGVPWVACNADRTIPTDAGPAPGHGSLVQLLSDFAGVRPRVAGKPAAPLLQESVRRRGGARPLMVGDRLDTDIEGARAAGIPSLLVLTGVTGLAELVAAPPTQRPCYLAADLGGLVAEHSCPRVTGDQAVLGGWSARVHEGRVEVTGAGEADDWWRCVATAAWQYRDRTGEVPDVAGLSPPVSESAGTLGA